MRGSTILLLMTLPMFASAEEQSAADQNAADREEIARSLALPNAIRLALEHNRHLAVASLQVEARRLDPAAAATDFSWLLRPEGELLFTEDQPEGRYGLEASRRFTPGTEIRAQGGAFRSADMATGEWRGYATVGLSQPLFRNAGREAQTEGITLATEGLLAERRRWEAQRADLVAEVAEAFELLVRLEAEMAFNERSAGRMDRLTALSRARERQGRTTHVDVLRAELQLGEARARVANGRERIAAASEDLAELIGAPAGTVFRLEAPPMLEPEIPVSTDAVAIALSNRMDYAQVLQDLSASRRQTRLARRGLWPDLSLVTRVERYEADYDDEEPRWFAGVSTDSDLFRKRERIALQQAEIGERSAAETIALRERTIVREVQQALARCRRARTELELAERNGNLARTRVELASRLFDAGRGDHFSVTDAEAAYATAETARLAARAESTVSAYHLRRTLGTLVEHPDDLKPAAAGDRP